MKKNKAIRSIKQPLKNPLTGLCRMIPVPLGVVNKKGVIKYLNDRFVRLFGYSRPQIPTLKEWWRLAYPDENYRQRVLTSWSNTVEKALKENTDIDPMIYNITCKNGEVKMVKITGTLVDEYFLVTFDDVTAHEKADDLLRKHHEEIVAQHEEIQAQQQALIKMAATIEESEEKFRIIAEISVDLIFQINPQAIFTYCSPSAHSLLGFQVHEMVGKPFSEFITPDTLPIANEIFRRTLSGEIVRMMVIKAIKKNGEQTWVEVNTSPLFKHKEIIGLQGTARDITTRKLAEESLKRQSVLIRYFYDLPFLGMLIASPYDKKILKFNDQLCEILGYPREELTEKTWMEITHPDDVKKNMDKLESVLRRESESYTLEKRYIKKDGSIIYGILNVYCIREEKKEEDFFVATLQDITESKLAKDALKKSEKRFRSLIENLQVGVIVQNEKTEILLHNPKALALLGINQEQLLGKTSFDSDWNIIHEDGLPFLGNTHPVVRAIATKQPIENVVMGVFRPLKQDRIWLLVNAVPQLNPDGSVLQVICSFSDITVHKQTEEKLRQLSQAVEQAPISIVITNTDGCIQYVNPCFSQVTGYSEKEVIGQNPRILKSNKTSPDIHFQLWKAITNGDVWHGELINKKKNNELYFESAVISPIINAHKITTHYLAVKEDITERKHAEEELLKYNQQLQVQLNEIKRLENKLRDQANRDPLTGLYNRRYLYEQLPQEIAQATEQHYPISFVMIDLDYFKLINDKFGHDTGDWVLQTFAKQLIQQVRATDIVCRYGGEEFLVVLPNTPMDAAYRAAERWRISLEKLKTSFEENRKFRITLSSGIALFPYHGTTLETVISAADKALFQAKESGRNCVVVSSNHF